MNVDRRRLLQIFAALGAGGVGARPASAQGARFPLGVASGSPSADGFVIWTRLSAHGVTGAAPVAWKVFEDGAAIPVASGVEDAPPQFAHSVHVEVSGLRPDRWYTYEFSAMGATSPRGRARTFSAAGSQADRLRFAYASCQRYDHGLYWAYGHMAREAPDFVLFLGDYIYEGATSPRNAIREHPVRRARDLDDYRELYAGYRGDPLLQEMHRLCPWLVTWDDHEVQNNYTGDHSDKGDPDFAALRLAGYRAYYEHMPLRARTMIGALGDFVREGRLRIYDRCDFGDLARLHVLDARQYRTPPLCASNARDRAADCVARDDPARTMLGEAQEQWLAQGLASGSPAWNVICQQTRFTTDNYSKGEDHFSASDRWDGYTHARKRVIGMIERSAPRSTLIIGGDIHRNWVANVHARPFDVSSPVVAAEFCGTSLASLPGRSQASMDRDRKANPHCVLANSEFRGYGVVDLTPREASVSLRTVDARAEQQPPVETLATFRVRRGEGRVEKTG